MKHKRDSAIITARQHATSGFVREVINAIRILAKTRATFTSDDIWELISPHARLTNEPRALGGIMTAKALRELIEPTDDWAFSRMTSCNRRPKRIWRSKEFRHEE